MAGGDERSRTDSLRLKPDWRYDLSGTRQHYLIEAWIAEELIGRAHGWFEPGARFAIEKIEMTRGHRSRGHGAAVIEELRRKARQSGCSELVFQGVLSSNRRAIKLYESLGAHAVPISGELNEYVIAPP